MGEELVIRKLTIGGKMSREEVELLDDCKEIIDITIKELISDKPFADLIKETPVVFYIIQACWGFLRSIFNEWVDRGYHSAYILGRALLEYYIDICFLLKKDTKIRAEEYYEAWVQGREPFKNNKEFKQYRRIEDRAKSVGLSKLYYKNYKSLCSFSHVSLSASLIARHDDKFIKDKPKFLVCNMSLYLEMLDIISRKLNIVYSEPIKDVIKNKLEKFNKISEDWGEGILPNL